MKPAKAKGQLPVVLVVHENRGLNPHIEDVARRFALEDFIAFAPDALFPLGGYPGDEDAARTLFAKLDQAKTREDFLAAADMLGQASRAATAAWAWSASATAAAWPTSWRRACRDLAAAAPFYGNAAPLEDVPKIKAELLVVLAANDERINAAWPAYEAALKAADVQYALYQPAGTQHGFHNDTTPRYDEDAAREAWRRTTALFERTLRK